jgi:hypothetical protein
MENNYIIFNQSGRFGNAIFRYMAYIMLQKNNNKFKYILDTDFSKLDIPEYTFFSGLDYLNNDISSGYYDSIEQLRVSCNEIINADGFNTLGYIKRDIDISKLSTTPYINDKVGGGIYVKNTKVVNEDNFFNYIHMDTDDNTGIKKLPNNSNIFLEGYFQYDQIYLQNKSYILEFTEENKNIHEITTENERYSIS